MTTPRIGAPEWVAAQALPESTGNEIVRHLIQGASSRVFKSRVVATPPGSPAQADEYLVAASPTGAWAGQAGKIAFYLNTGWIFVTAYAGVDAFVIDEAGVIYYDGAAWQPLGLTVSNDTTMAADSVSAAPTQHAVRTYIANKLVGMLVLRGSTDCSANPNYPAAVKGDSYIVTVAGKIGGASGTIVAIGDVYFATADNAGGTQAAVGTSWDVLVHASVSAGGGLLAANNLSDVASASSSRSNLGLGTAATLASDNDATLAANSATALATQQAVKAYVDGLVTGLSWKKAVRAATTANGTLATAFANASAIDGVTLATGDRILLKNQTTGSENGIYTVNASGAPTRATDADAGAELVNATCYVSEGTANADTQWTCSTNAPITPGTTSLTFAQLSSGAGGLAAANNLSDVASKVASKDNISTKGTDIVSAATTDLSTATGDFVDVTGTTTITALGTAAAGVERQVRFTGILTLTYNATSLILPTAASIVTAAGDAARFRSLGSGNWVCVAFMRASGSALTGTGGGLLAVNNLSDVASAAAAQTNLGLLRLVAFFFTTTPTASEVLSLYVAADAFTLPANLSGSQVKVGTNATATFALDLQRNGTTIGTISIATSGTATLTTTSGTSKAIAIGDVLKVVAPGTVDTTIANVAITLKGTL